LDGRPTARAPPARFGLLELRPDARVAKALIEACATEARRRGHQRLIGPCDPSALDAPGVLSAVAADGEPVPAESIPPLLAAGGAGHEHLLTHAGLQTVGWDTVLEARVEERGAHAAPASRARRRTLTHMALGETQPGPIKEAILRALATRRQAILGRPPLDDEERRAERARLEQLLVPELCFSLARPDHETGDPALVAGLAHVGARRALRGRLGLGLAPGLRLAAGPGLGTRLGRRLLGGRPTRAPLHVIVVLPAAFPAGLVATCLVEPTLRAERLGFGPTTVSLLMSGSKDATTVEHSPAARAWDEARTTLEAVAHTRLRRVTVFGRDL
jgi:hypothetical protein